MALYDRLLGREGVARIPVHAFQAILAEYARGRLTGAQAQALVAEVSGEVLDAAGVSEALALLATVTGSATAKLARAAEIDHVLLLADVGASGYRTPAEIKARLGVS